MSDLTSKTTARVIDVIGEGEVEGVVNGDKGVYLNGTQLQSNSGSYNFEGVRTNFRNGTLNQTYMPGYRSVETEIPDGREIENVSPISFNVTDAEVDALSIKLRVNGLSDTDSDDGDVHETEVIVEIWRRPNGGAFSKAGTVTMTGKSTSMYERQKRVSLPSGGFPYTIELRRITPDTTNVDVVNKTFFPTYTMIYDLKLRYPYTALVGLEVDAEKFGQQFPARRYRVRGVKVKYPSNYNPTTRVYTGIWDGTFTTGYCRNPAWILADLMVNKIYGLGDRFNLSNIDKFGLYTIAQYCDGMVPDGQGGTEPRYVFNGVINKREDAAKVLDSIASVFRGMIYWQSGSVAFAHDAPGTPIKDVVPANVINGEFSYAGSALKARHSAVIVSWNDPASLGELSYEVVQRDDLIAKFGYREKPVGAIGCTSRGQARRVGEWLLDTEENETELVTYRAALDHADVRPGQLIRIADPTYAGARMGGRIMAVAGNLKSVTVDGGVDILAGETYSINITLPDGTIVSRALTNATGNNQTVLTYNTALPNTPVDNAIWSVTASNVEPRPFRVMAVYERNGVFEVHALFHDVTKYARIERNRQIDTPDYSLPGQLLPPSSVTFKEFTKDNGDEYVAAVTVSFGSANDARSNGFQYQIKEGNDKSWSEIRTIKTHSFDHAPARKGLMTVRGRTVGKFDDPSPWLSNTYTVLGYAFPSPATSLSVSGENRRLILEFPENPSPKFKRWVIYGSQTNLFSTATIIDYNPGRKRWVYDHLTPGQVWYFWIVAQDKKGNNSERFPLGPLGNNGVSGVVGYITESDDDPTTPDAPTGLTLSQTRTENRDGVIVHRVHMTCNVPPGVNSKADYIYYISDGVNPEWTHVSKDRTTEFVATWNTTYAIRVLVRKANGVLGNITAVPLIITTVKKPSTTLPTPSGLTVTPGIKNNAVMWNGVDENTYRDLDFTAVWWNTTGVTPTPGVTTISRKVTGTGFAHENLTITSYSYWIAHKDKSGNWTPLSGPITGTPVRVLDDDVDPNGLPAPTGLTLGQITERDISGTIRKYVTMTCTPPAGANAKTYYVYTVSSNLIGDWPFSVVSDTPSARFIAKIGVTYDINARAIKFSNAKGTPTANLTITPVKKVSDLPLPTGLTVVSKTNRNRIDFTDMDIDVYPDYAESVLYRNQTGVTPTPGVTLHFKKGRVGYFDDPNVVKGATWQYWLCHRDTSGNYSAIAGPVGVTALGVGSGDVEDKAINAAKISSADPGGLVLNGKFIDGNAGWTFAANTTVVGDAPTSFGGAFILRTSDRDGAFSDWFDIDNGEAIFARAYAYVSSTEDVNLMLHTTDDANGNNVFQTFATTSAKTLWTQLQGTIVCANANARRGRILLQCNKTQGTTLTTWNYWGKVKARRAAHKQSVVAGAIGSTELGIGSGVNQIINSNFATKNLNNWRAEYSNDATKFVMSYVDSTYTPRNGCLQIRQIDGTAALEYGFCPADETGAFDYYTVEGDKWYELSAYYHGHRCNGIQPYIQWIDGAGVHISYSSLGIFPANQGINPNKQLKNFERAWGKLQAPTNAATVLVFFRMKGTITGQADSFLWFYKPVFAECNPNQSEATPWAPAGINIANSSNIAPAAVIEDKLSDNAVTPRKTKRIDTTNLLRDPDCTDITLWNGTGGVTTAATALVSESANVLSIPATTAIADIYTDVDIPVKAGKKYYVNGFSGPSNGVSCQHWIQIDWYSMNALGAFTFLSGSLVGAAITGTVVTEKEGIVTAPANARRAVLVARKQASAGAANATLYGPVFRRAAAVDMIPDGDIADAKTDQTAPATPGIPSLTPPTAEITGDGTVDTGLVIAFTAASPTPRAIKKYRVDLYRSATVGGADLTGYSLHDSFFTKQISVQRRLNDRYFYKAVVTAITANDVEGAATLPTATGIKPSQYNAMTGFVMTAPGIVQISNGFDLTWVVPADLTYIETEILITGISPAVAQAPLTRVKGTKFTDKIIRTVGSTFAYAVRHYDRSGNPTSISGNSVTTAYRASISGEIGDSAVIDVKGDPTPPGKPNAAPALVATGDYNKDGAIDGGLTLTITAPVGGRGVKKYRVELYRSTTLGTPANNVTGYTLFDTIETRALTKDIRGNSKYFYKARAIPISANDVEGTPSDYTFTGVQPASASNPAAPSGVLLTYQVPYGFGLRWAQLTDVDYLRTDITSHNSATVAPVSDALIITSVTAKGVGANPDIYVYWPKFQGSTTHIWIRHVNRSGNVSAWVYVGLYTSPELFFDSVTTDAILDNAVTLAKMADNSVDTINIIADAINANFYANDNAAQAVAAATKTMIEEVVITYPANSAQIEVFGNFRKVTAGAHVVDISIENATGTAFKTLQNVGISAADGYGYIQATIDAPAGTGATIRMYVLCATAINVNNTKLDVNVRKR